MKQEKNDSGLGVFGNQLENERMESVKNLKLCCLSPEQNQQTCNYWYTVTVNGVSPHTAFNTEKRLRQWLSERGLSIEGDLPPRGEWGVFNINGSYKSNRMMDKEAFDALVTQDHPQIKVLDNAEFTLGVLTKDTDGVVAVNFLNCNIRDRQIFDYNESREVLEPFAAPDQFGSSRPRT